MIKSVIFVEGQTELIVTREFLLKFFEYAEIEIECYKLIVDNNAKKVSFDYLNPSAKFHFQIINVGNDKSVLSAIFRREKHLLKNNYTKIIGLRDMYSKEYNEFANEIKTEIISKFITNTNEQIVNFESDIDIRFHYAIMEIEAWFLAISQLFQRYDSRLSNEHIYNRLALNLFACNPETDLFHPSKQVEKILNLIGVKYDKSKSIVEAIVGAITKDDIKELLESNKCKSFRDYWQDVISAN